MTMTMSPLALEDSNCSCDASSESSLFAGTSAKCISETGFLDEPQHQRKRRKPKVHFRQAVAVLLVPPSEDFSDEEFFGSYYTREDYEYMQEEILTAVKTLRKGPKQITNPNEITFRGIEHMKSSTSIKSRKTRKRTIVDAVLEEQYSQSTINGHCDPRSLFKISCELSLYDRAVALEKAKSDANFVVSLRRRFSDKVKQESRQGSLHSSSKAEQLQLKKSDVHSLMSPLVSLRLRNNTPRMA